MLKHLNDVAWNQLQHAQGCASDTPLALAGLYSADPFERLDAFEWLMSTIWCNHEIYSATVEAVPFLVSFLEDPLAPCRGRVLTALFWIAKSCGRPEQDYARATLAALNASVPALLDVYHAQGLRAPERAMLLLVLSFCRGQARYIRSEICGETEEERLLLAILRNDDLIGRDVLFMISAGCEDDQELETRCEAETAIDCDEPTQVMSVDELRMRRLAMA